jgi:Zn-dependent protease with chaperone function
MIFHKACLATVDQVCANCGKQCDAVAEMEAASHSHGDLAMKFMEGGFQRGRTSPLYRLGLMLVALGMVLLPALYLGLIALSGFAVLSYAIRFSSLLGAADFGVEGALGILVFYVAPVLAGAAMTLLLLKPLFAPRPVLAESFALNHADAPRLFALIGWICRSLNAPMPSRVDVDCSVNAGADLRGGFRSIFGADIALRVGLPLVAGMNLSQFAGIIAHEYGHFSQGAAMRAHYLIRAINDWFGRVVYERDMWDLALEHATEAEDCDPRLVVALWLVRAGIACGRGVLWLLMALGGLLSSFMSRQMELDADRYEMKFCGSATFISTTLRLQQLNLGADLGQRQLIAKWKKEKKLFDQIPDFIVGRANEISADAQERCYARALQRKTRLFDSHPSDAARIERARAAREPGVFHDTAPATSLFADYPELSRRLTLFFYRDVTGREIAPESLIPGAPASSDAEDDRGADRQSLQRWFLGIATDSRPIIIRENKALVFRREEVLRAEMQACRRQMEESLPAARDAFAEFNHAESRRSQARQAAQLLDAGFQFDPAEFGLADTDTDTAQAGAEEPRGAADAVLRKFEAAAQCRLTDAVQLLRLPQVAAKIPNAAKLQDEAREMIFVLSRLGDFFEPLLELREDCAALELLLLHRRSQPAADNIGAVLDDIATAIQQRVNAIQEQARQVRYPFPHATERALLSDYARNKEYNADPFELALREGRSHVEKLLNLYCRILSWLVMICEEVERER